MTLFFTLFPLYIFGNVHCFGMCGPLVMMIGQHRFRYCYFLGRLFSFSLAGLLAGEAGAVLHLLLKQYHLAEFTSFIFGSIIFLIGLSALLGWRLPSSSFAWMSPFLQSVNQFLSTLMLKDTGWSTFLFGFFTVFLPCGQSLVVFSACALSADAVTGLLNGFALAFLTSPSLLFAMHMHRLLKGFKKHYNILLGACSMLIGTLAVCRGLAELGLISHWVLNPEADAYYHIVVF